MKLTDEKLSFLKRIIEIKSVGGDPEPGAPFGKESREVLEVFLNDAKSKGFTTNVFNDKVGYIEYGTGDKTIGIICHLDVVPAGEGWETDPFTLTIKDGAMYARGIIDDKGPAIASYFAMQKLMEENIDLGYKVRLILGTDEERTCDCMAEYVSNPDTVIPDIGFTPDAEFPAIFAEKGILQVIFKTNGIDGLEVTGGNAPNMVPAACHAIVNGVKKDYQGKSAHGSKPELGINAIHKCVEDIDNKSDLLDFIRYFFLGNQIVELTGCDFSDDSGALSTNLGMITINKDIQTCSLDIRYPASYEYKKLTSALNVATAKFNLTLEIGHHIKPLMFDKNSAHIKAIMNAWNKNIERFSNVPSDLTPYHEAIAIGGGTYARHVPNIVAFGPQTPWSEDQCHQANEHITINDFEVSIDVIYDALHELSKN